MDPYPTSHRDEPLDGALPEIRNFSLVLGGPLYQLFRRVHLDDDVTSHVRQRMITVCGIIWLPLLLLCAITGTLLDGIAVPFLLDVETHARFLLAVPLMIYAELLVHQRVRDIVMQFVERKLVPEASMERFRKAILNALAWRNSIPAELVIVALVLPLGYYVRTRVFALESSTWYATAGSDGANLTLPGIWFSWVSNPLVQFLMLRWIYRIAIWTRLLWQVSRIELNLIPTHPDRNAGLGFLAGSAHAYSPLLASFSVMVAGMIASRIFHEGASLAGFKLEILSLVIFCMFLVLAPLTVFVPQILLAKRRGKREYGIFAAEYTREFDRRWLRNADHDETPLLGTGDIQSLADLDNAYAVITGIRAVPFNRDLLLQLVWATLAPFAPLVLTMIPLEELLDRMIKAVF
ncbi:MAG: hypothetical protein MUF86_04045 [Akkermansiaceae bacterium]|jgi:hypothetical protein|nr:hypothetical protein [Akkermansiaceae bacterium]MCU0776819.1 hypothetical protein [Akkermansiaceae bacterium]